MGLLDPPGAPRPAVGLLAARPAATGSLKQYFASDDAGGCLHVDTGTGAWKRLHPRGELAALEIGQQYAYTNTGGLVSLLGAYLEIVPDTRPVEVTFTGMMQIGRTDATDTAIAAGGTKYARVTINETVNGVGTTVGEDRVFGTVLGYQGRVNIAVRRSLIPGQVYKYQVYQGSQDATVSVRPVATPRMIFRVVEL